MQVSKDILPMRSYSIILCRCDSLNIPSINLNWIKSYSVVYSSCPSFSNSQYLLAFRRRCWYFMIGSSTSCFIDILSATINLSLDLIFLHMIWLTFSKDRSSRFIGYATVDTFIITSHPASSQKEIRNLIFWSLFFVVFQIFDYYSHSKTSLPSINKIGIHERPLVSYRRCHSCDAQG